MGDLLPSDRVAGDLIGTADVAQPDDTCPVDGTILTCHRVPFELR